VPSSTIWPWSRTTKRLARRGDPVQHLPVAFHEGGVEKVPDDSGERQTDHRRRREGDEGEGQRAEVGADPGPDAGERLGGGKPAPSGGSIPLAGMPAPIWTVGSGTPRPDTARRSQNVDVDRLYEFIIEPYLDGAGPARTVVDDESWRARGEGLERTAAVESKRGADGIERHLVAGAGQASKEGLLVAGANGDGAGWTP